MEPTKTLSPAIKALIVIVLVGIVATAVIVISDSSSDKENATTSQDTPTTSSSSPEASETSTNAYKNGTYSAVGSYSTPGGQESIDLTVTITDGVITSTTLKENATSGEAEEHQANFASGYKSFVVGKKVDEVSLSRVAGSSLTSNGFNSALDDIKKDAAA
jgi:hypothetical protein